MVAVSEGVGVTTEANPLCCVLCARVHLSACFRHLADRTKVVTFIVSGVGFLNWPPLYFSDKSSSSDLKLELYKYEALAKAGHLRLRLIYSPKLSKLGK